MPRIDEPKFPFARLTPASGIHSHLVMLRFGSLLNVMIMAAFAVMPWWLAASFVPAEDGIYATISVRAGDELAGEFTCKLTYEQTPQTVANFIGLATGEQAWWDAKTGTVSHAPFYSGITFHRVIDRFMIQAGSPKGDGTDGPGYSFRDEIVDALKHDRAGILSMANSGPHTNGSQFFVTLVPTSHLNGDHTVFGHVVDGLEFVQQLGLVAVNPANAQPRDPVLIDSVRITRVGAAAEAFSVAAQGLPQVRVGALRLFAAADGPELRLHTATNVQSVIHGSDDLREWAHVWKELEVGQGGERRLPVTDFLEPDGPVQGFFRAYEVAYPDPQYAPPSIAGKTLSLTYDIAGDIVIHATFTEDGGTFRSESDDGPASGNIGYFYEQQPYRAYLGIGFSTGFVQQRISLMFESFETGNFISSFETQYGPGELTGTFRMVAEIVVD